MGERGEKTEGGRRRTGMRREGQTGGIHVGKRGAEGVDETGKKGNKAE